MPGAAVELLALGSDANRLITAIEQNVVESARALTRKRRQRIVPVQGEVPDHAHGHGSRPRPRFRL